MHEMQLLFQKKLFAHPVFGKINNEKYKGNIPIKKKRRKFRFLGLFLYNCKYRIIEKIIDKILKNKSKFELSIVSEIFEFPIARIGAITTNGTLSIAAMANKKFSVAIFRSRGLELNRLNKMEVNNDVIRTISKYHLLIDLKRNPLTMRVANRRKQQLRLSCGFPREIIINIAKVFDILLFTSILIVILLRRKKLQTIKI
jgi:hypothetical protein